MRQTPTTESKRSHRIPRARAPHLENWPAMGGDDPCKTHENPVVNLWGFKDVQIHKLITSISSVANPVGEYLAKHLSKPPTRVEFDALKNEITTIKAAMREIKELFAEPKTLDAPGAFSQWKQSAAAREFHGKHVAFLPGVGVIGSADTLDDLVAQIGDDPRKHLAAFDLIYRGDI